MIVFFIWISNHIIISSLMQIQIWALFVATLNVLSQTAQLPAFLRPCFLFLPYRKCKSRWFPPSLSTCLPPSLPPLLPLTQCCLLPALCPLGWEILESINYLCKMLVVLWVLDLLGMGQLYERVSFYLPHNQVYSVLKWSMSSVCFCFWGDSIFIMALFIPQNINTELRLGKK